MNKETSEFNSCAKLLNNEKITNAVNEYNYLKNNSKDPFEFMLSMQKELQIALFHKNPKVQNINELNTLGEIADWLRDNKIAFDDEYRETVDALAGMEKSPKERSALWKKWKANYDTLRSEKLEDLSEDERTELKFEICDMFHFFMNMMLSVNLTAEEMFVYYLYKNKENFDRIKRGY